MLAADNRRAGDVDGTDRAMGGCLSARRSPRPRSNFQQFGAAPVCLLGLPQAGPRADWSAFGTHATGGFGEHM